MNYFQTINPYTRQPINQYEIDSKVITHNKITLADNAFRYWANVKTWERSDILKRLGALLRQNKIITAALITEEMGKPVTEALAEVEKCALTCDYYSQNLQALTENLAINTEYNKSYITYQPLGIILGIMPWNFPLWQVIRFAIPALAAGNVVLLKHSQNVLGCSLILESIFLNSGFPEGVFQNLIVEAESIKEILADSRIKGVSLTGSEKAGRSVASLAGNYIKKSVLELGGNDPFIVLKDADLDKAAEVALQSRLQNCGQVCISAKRIIVEETVKEAFTRKILDKIKDWNPADPTLHETKMGPLARLDIAENLEKQYLEALKHGAVALTEYHRKDCMVQPIILDNVCHESVVFREETFGPLTAIVSARTEEYAVALANDSRFGLGATIFTEDKDKGEKLALRINSGIVFVNELVRSDPRYPVGGINNSGYGRELGSLGLKEFVNAKTVVIN